MEYLPFLVVHGGWLWKVAVLLIGVLAALLLVARTRKRARRSAEAQRLRLGPALPLESAGEGDLVVLSGKLGLEGSPTTRLEDKRPAAVATASPTRLEGPAGALAISRAGEGLYLELAGAVVELEGDVEVRAGSEERWFGKWFMDLPRRRWATLKALDTETFEALRRQPAVFRSLQAGDPVRAGGRLRSKASSKEEAETSRNPAARWLLTTGPLSGDEDDGKPLDRAIPLVFEGAPRARGPVLSKLVTVALLSGAVALVSLSGLSLLMKENYRDPDELWVRAPGDPGAAPGLPPCNQPIRPTVAAQLAAALPFSREGVIHQLRFSTDGRCRPDRGQILRSAALAELNWGCPAGVSKLLNHGAPGRAAAALGRCGSKRESVYDVQHRYRLALFQPGDQSSRLPWSSLEGLAREAIAFDQCDL